MNMSGPWSPAAVKAISRFPLATFEKAMDGGNHRFSEVNCPAACKQIHASNPDTVTLYYLNSVKSYPEYDLQGVLAENPAWALKNTETGADLGGSLQLFNLSVATMKDLWIADCINATDAGR
jgi:hypothetical protein